MRKLISLTVLLISFQMIQAQFPMGGGAGRGAGGGQSMNV